MANQPPISETLFPALGNSEPSLGDTASAYAFWRNRYAADQDMTSINALLSVDRRADLVFPNAHTQANALAKLGTAALFNSPMMGKIGGGSLLSTYAGLQTTASSSGLRMNTDAGAQQWFGHGALTNSVAFRLTENMQRQFFTNGVNQIGQTGGLNRTDMGMLAKSLADRGAFAGMRAGSMVGVTVANRDSLADRAAASGAGADTVKSIRSMNDGMIADIDPGFAQRFNDKLRDAAKTIGAIKDVVGGRPLEELVKIMEGLGGGSAASSAVVRTASQRMAGISTLASAYGRDASMLLNDTMVNVNMGLGMGLSKSTASSFAYNVTRSAVLGSQYYKTNSITAGSGRAGVGDLLTEEDIRARHLGDLAGAASSEAMGGTLAIKDYMAQHAGDLAANPANRARLEAALNGMTAAYGKGGTAVKDAQNMAASEFAAITGMSHQRYLANAGGTKVVMNRTAITDEAEAFNRHQAIYGNGQLRSATKSFYEGYSAEAKAIVGDEEEFFNFSKGLRMNASSAQLADIGEQLAIGGSNKQANIEKILSGSRLTAGTAKETADRVTKLGLGRYQDLINMFQQDKATAGIPSDGDIADSSEREAAAYFARMKNFGDAKSPASLFGRFSAGLLGAGDIGESGRLKLGLAGLDGDAITKAGVLTLAAGEDGGYKHTSGDFDKLDSTQKAELARLGVLSDSDLATAAGGSQRNTVARAMMKNRNMAYSDDGKSIYIDDTKGSMTARGAAAADRLMDQTLGVVRNTDGKYSEGELAAKRREAIKDNLSKLREGNAEVSGAALAVSKDDSAASKIIMEALQSQRDTLVKKDKTKLTESERTVLSTYDKAAEMNKATEEKVVTIKLAPDGAFIGDFKKRWFEHDR